MRCHGRRKERFFFAGEFFRGGGVSGVVQRRSRWCQRAIIPENCSHMVKTHEYNVVLGWLKLEKKDVTPARRV